MMLSSSDEDEVMVPTSDFEDENMTEDEIYDSDELEAAEMDSDAASLSGTIKGSLQG